jgi:cation transport regulator ChaC
MEDVIVDTPHVWVFFYGSTMNVNVLKALGVEPVAWETARLGGFEVSVRPRVNVARSNSGTVYGVVVSVTHDELTRLYTHLRDEFGQVYAAEAVLVETADGKWRPALCYVCPTMEPRAADPRHVEDIAAAVRSLHFPAWYVQKIEAFKR